jgi:hypothetical protein
MLVSFMNTVFSGKYRQGQEKHPFYEKGAIAESTMSIGRFSALFRLEIG